MDDILLSQLQEVSNSLTRIETLLLNIQEIATKIVIKVYENDTRR